MKLGTTNKHYLLVLALLIMSSITEANHNNDSTNDIISIASWNSRGMLTSIPYLNILMKDNDIITISEHWLHANCLHKLLDISDEFYCISRASKHSCPEQYGVRRGQGGVAIFWRKTLNGVSPISEIIHDRMCGLRLQTKSKRIVNIFSIYLPSQGSADFGTVIDECAEIVNDREPNAFNIICGDYNGDVGHLGGRRSNRKPTKNGVTVSKFFEEFSLFPANLSQIAVGPVTTFKGGMGSSTIDYIAVPEGLRDNLISCEVLNDDIMNTSDHYAVKAKLKLHCLPQMVSNPGQKGRISWKKTGTRQSYLDMTHDKIANLAGNFKWDTCTTEEVDQVINTLAKNLQEAGEKLPRSKFRSNVKPFWNRELTELKRVKVECFNLWKAAGRPRDADHQLFQNHKIARKAFMRELKRVQKEHKRNEIGDIIKAAHNDRISFWKKVKKVRNPKQHEVFAVRNEGGNVVYDINEVVQVWSNHFERISLPRQSPSFDDRHFKHVTDSIKMWYNDDDEGEFLTQNFTSDEVIDGLKALKRGKAAGCDGLTTEHFIHAGETIVTLVRDVLNSVIRLEYIPENFRRGTQIPLYKGKNLCPLDVNNYRGITLLTCMNKLFEVIVWERLKFWWEDQGIISRLQSACRTGSSCIHSALILQESIADGLDTKKKVFVAYFDAAKAFDSVWTDGLFYQLRNLGINGKLWRLLYKSYEELKCKVRLMGTYSDWYSMRCGIHQGGVLSLLKYVAFIDPLLREIEHSGLAYCIARVPTSPVGYADDLSVCSTSKCNLDQSMKVVYEYSCKWRFFYNPGKSAVMVYGERKNEATKNSKYRNFSLGGGGGGGGGGVKVKERSEYDHVGIKNCLYGNTLPRTEDRISRGRRAFNAVASIGIKSKGVNMAVCNILFWSIIAPIVTYGSEVWVLQPDEQELLRKFQRYVCRRCQRFPPRSPNFSTTYPMGWMDIVQFINVKKMLFLRTIITMPDDAICKRVLVHKATEYRNDPLRGTRNAYNSPINELLNVSREFGILELCLDLIENGCHLSKYEWKKKVWEIAWQKEDEMYDLHRNDALLFRVIDRPFYLIFDSERRN